MPRGKNSFISRECGYASLGWLGRCPGCGRWNITAEVAPQVSAFSRKGGGATSRPVPVRLGEVDAGAHSRIDTGLGELNRVLGGGLVAGCVLFGAGRREWRRARFSSSPFFSGEGASVPTPLASGSRRPR